MTEGDTLIDNSETGDLVQNNSQLHPGFPTSGSAPGTPPTGTVSPALQTAVQAPPAATADQGFSDEDEAEVESMMDDAMDMINHIVDIFDEDAVDDAEDTALTAYAEASANQPTLQPYETDQHPYLPEVQYSLSDDLLSSETEDSGLPDLEEVLEPHETDQQTVDSSECLHHHATQRADHSLYSGRRGLHRGPISSSRERKKPMVDRYSTPKPCHRPQTTLQPPPNRPKRHPSLPRHHLRPLPENNHHHSVTKHPFITTRLPSSPEPGNGPRFRQPRRRRTPQHDGPDPRTGHRHHRQPSGARGRLDDDEVASAVAIGIQD